MSCATVSAQDITIVTADMSYADSVSRCGGFNVLQDAVAEDLLKVKHQGPSVFTCRDHCGGLTKRHTFSWSMVTCTAAPRSGD